MDRVRHAFVSFLLFWTRDSKEKQSEIAAEGAHYRMAVRRQLGNTAGSRGRIGISWQRVSMLSTGREWPSAATECLGGHCSGVGNRFGTTGAQPRILSF